MKFVQQSSKSGAGTGEIFVPSFIHFERLMFLKETNEVDLSVSFTHIQENTYDSFFTTESEKSKQQLIVPSPKNPQTKKRKVPLEDTANLQNETLNAAIATLNEIKSKKFDECDAHGIVYASKLKSLSGQDRWDLIDEVNACIAKRRSS